MKFSDQLNRHVELAQFPPKRIVSVVPSQTELLFDLGLDEEVIGITKFCVHPEHWFRNKVRIGGTKKLNISLIRQLTPDLVIANKEENLQSEVELLAKEFPVWISDIENLSGAYDMIEKVGELTDRIHASKKLVKDIKSKFNNEVQSENRRPLRAAYLIWREPYMAAGGDTFIGDMIRIAGLENVFERKLRYPEISLNQLSALNCEVVLLSSEPYPFTQKHAEELERNFGNMRIVLVDGEMFSWYGSRLLLAPSYLRQLRELILNS